MSKWTVGADRNLPIVERDEWDGDAAKSRVFEWAGWDDDPDPTKARRAFLAYDAEKPENRTSYKLPFADIVDGKLVAVTGGLRAAASRLPQSDLPDDVKERARQVLDHYQERREQAKRLRFKVQVPGIAAKAAGVRVKAAPPKKSWQDLEGAPEVDVLLLPYGGPEMGRDADGEAFHTGTDFWLREGMEVPVTYYHGFGPDDWAEWQETPAVIGVMKMDHEDEAGVWFRARLDEAEPLARRVLDALKDGKEVRASSGAIHHLVRVRRSGLIDVWPLAEGAIFDVNDWRRPANDYAVVQPAKGVEVEPEVGEARQAGAPAVITTKSKQEQAGGADMEKEELKALVSEALKEQAPELVEMLKQPVEAIAAKWIEENVRVRNLPGAKGGKEKDERVKAFLQWVKAGGDPTVKALSISTDGDVLVPAEQQQLIYLDLQEQSLYRKMGVTVIPVKRNSIRWPTMSFSGRAHIVGEGADMSGEEHTPTLANVTVQVYKYAYLSKVTTELLADSVEDVWGSIIVPDYVNGFAEAENEDFTTGTGSGQPQGLVTGVSNVVTAAAANAISYNDIVHLFHAVDYRRRANAVWIMHDTTAEMLAQLTDGNGRPLWVPSMAEGEPATLFGRPIYTVNYMPTVAASAKVIVFGDPKGYFIFDRRQIGTQRLTEHFALQGQVGFLGTERVSGRVMIPAAFAVLQMAAA